MSYVEKIRKGIVKPVLTAIEDTEEEKKAKRLAKIRKAIDANRSGSKGTGSSYRK